MMNLNHIVVYQIYPKSFKDTNQDGIGDLKGVIQKLDYLADLGIDYLWLNPFYRSPQHDNGYDIADYYKVEEMYGDMGDVEELIAQAKKRNMEVMLDLAINHTSTQHRWFQLALQGDPKYKNYYIFKKGKENNALPPTNWESKFGGSCWEYVDSLDEYYLHLFDKTQADLNWDNKEVREDLYRIVNFWIDKGVKGFRFDVINLISKPAVFYDDLEGDGRRFYTDGPNVHSYLKELHAKTFGRHPDIITVGEMSSTTIEDCIRYSNPEEKELSMVFSFHHLKMDYKDQKKWELMPLDFMALKDHLSSWQVAMQESNGWSALFWCNHDQPRIVGRIGDDDEFRVESAKMLATAMHLMRGTPYIYQGEEIGMTNAHFTSIEQYRDVETLNYYDILSQQGLEKAHILEVLAARSRDNARTPMQWDDRRFAGFGEHQPWLDVNDNYKKINVQKNLVDENSVFHYYQKLIQLRKQSKVIQSGTFRLLLADHPQVFAYERMDDETTCIVLCNFYGEEAIAQLDVDVSSYQYILGNYKTIDDTSNHNPKQIRLRPYETIVLMRNH